MLKNIVLAGVLSLSIGVLSLSIALPALATPYPVYPTESEFLRYEYGLASFFSNVQQNSTYIRKSDRQRRFDGQIVCGMLTDYSVGEYLSIRIQTIKIVDRSDPKKMTDEIAYLFGVTASAIDNMCSENRAEFIDFVDELKRKGFSPFQ